MADFLVYRPQPRRRSYRVLRTDRGLPRRRQAARRPGGARAGAARGRRQARRRGRGGRRDAGDGLIGLLGGTFDPPHNGHVALARAGIDHFGLERLLVAADRPHARQGGRVRPGDPAAARGGGVRGRPARRGLADRRRPAAAGLLVRDGALGVRPLGRAALPRRRRPLRRLPHLGAPERGAARRPPGRRDPAGLRSDARSRPCSKPSSSRSASSSSRSRRSPCRRARSARASRPATRSTTSSRRPLPRSSTSWACIGQPGGTLKRRRERARRASDLTRASTANRRPWRSEKLAEDIVILDMRPVAHLHRLPRRVQRPATRARRRRSTTRCASASSTTRA